MFIILVILWLYFMIISVMTFCGVLLLISTMADLEVKKETLHLQCLSYAYNMLLTYKII